MQSLNQNPTKEISRNLCVLFYSLNICVEEECFVFYRHSVLSVKIKSSSTLPLLLLLLLLKAVQSARVSAVKLGPKVGNSGKYLACRHGVTKKSAVCLLRISGRN